jgi:nucleotide-binding universal stress UspA family protein
VGGEYSQDNWWIAIWRLGALLSIPRALIEIELKQNPLLTNILVLTDFSQASQGALPHAIAIAGDYKAEITLLHVILPELFSFKDKSTIRDAAGQAMKKIEGGLPPNVPHRVLIEQGAIWPVILDVLGKYKADLIVTGSRGRTGLEILFLGSFAETVFRRAECPVLTVGPKSNPAKPNSVVKNVLFATDFSAEAEAAEPYAFSFALRRQAKLSLLHVVKPGFPRGGNRQQSDQQRLSYAKDRLGATASYDAGRQLSPTPNLITEVGPVVETIIDVATRLKADLIVLGASAPHAVADRLGETPAYRVVCAAPCPVLTVRQPSPVDYFKRLYKMMPKSKTLASRPMRSSGAPPYCWWC